MEHNAEKLIQEKIRQAEQVPVSWKNEWVWSRVQLPAKRKNSRVWFAVAAVAMIGMISFMFYWDSVKYQSEMMTQLSALESQLGKMELLASQNDAAIEICDEEESTLMNTANVVISKRARIEVPSIMELEIADVMVTDYSVEATNDNPDNVATLIDSPSDLIIAERQEIKPIIGKIPSTSQYPEITNSSGLKVVVFNSNDSHLNSSTDSKEYKILNARINR